MSENKYEQFKKETENDTELQSLRKVVMNGWPDEKEEIPNELTKYWNYRDEISCIDGIMFKNHKLMVPKQMRAEMLEIIHESHLGMVKCKSRARDTLFWPGMGADIDEYVAKCTICAQAQRSNIKEPLKPTEIPERPWYKIAVDLCEIKGHHYLVSVDYYSKWLEMAKLDNLSSGNTIMYMKSQFSRYGVPDEVVSDNGPQFSSHEFEKFKQDYGFKHITSSAHFAQSNGQCEKTVGIVKNLVTKSKDPYKALLAYRNTKIDDIGLSPAQIFLGRMLKTTLPTAAPLLTPENSKEIQNKLKNRQLKQKKYYDHGKKHMPELQNGQRIVIQNERNKRWEPATVLRKHHMPRSYVVEGDNGGVYRRNRYHLRPTHASFPTPNEDNQYMPQNEHVNISDKDTNIRDNNTNVQDNLNNNASNEASQVKESSYGLRSRSEINKPLRFRDENFV